ncbi:DUF4362 domain-containing protein [Cohnella suwonensis]|uniref:DUF4362 domain-containing protein n=1 Tax=Cohnella suwonensis TaxID=696072 RepID=A0ABW0M3W8_9BACL
MRSRIIVLALFSIIYLSGCGNSKPYNYETAVDHGDIVDLHGKITNTKRLEEFNQNILQNNKDKIRITRITIEGDPLFFDFHFNGKEIKFRYDNSKDKYGTSNIRSTACKSLITRKSERGIEYSLNGCYGKNEEIGNNFKFEVINQ